jgi:hypothetical protein
MIRQVQSPFEPPNIKPLRERRRLGGAAAAGRRRRFLFYEVRLGATDGAGAGGCGSV